MSEAFAEGSLHQGWRVTAYLEPAGGALLGEAAPPLRRAVVREADGASGRLEHFSWAGSMGRWHRDMARRARAAVEAAGAALAPVELLEREDGLVVITPAHDPLPGSLSPGEALEALRGAAQSLEPLHARGLAHGELEPSLLVRGPAGTRLLPPGLRQPAEDLLGLGVAADPRYAAPEVLDGRPATPASDCFSLGLLLYHLLTGKHPVEETDPQRALLARAAAPAPDLAAACPGLTPQLASLHRRLCAPYAARPGDAGEVLRDLERCRDRPLPPPSAPRARVHAERMGLAVVAALLAGGTLVVAATSAAVLAPGSCLEGVAFPLPGPDGPAAVDSGSAPR